MACGLHPTHFQSNLQFSETVEWNLGLTWAGGIQLANVHLLGGFAKPTHATRHVRTAAEQLIQSFIVVFEHRPP